MSFPIDVLPKEVLHHVFCYLSIADRLSASLVCKRWLNVINCKSLLRDIKILINDNNTVPVFINMSRNFLNFSFKLIIVDNKYFDLFKRFSSAVEYLSFEKCEIWKREPVKFDLTYENLRVLKIIDCDLWSLFPYLPNLIELYLSGNSTITDDGIAILQKSMKHLTTLSLDCNIAFDVRAYRRFYRNEASYEKNPSSLILSLPAVKSFISERVNTLKELNLPCSITPVALKEISSIKNLCLNKIDLSGCPACVDSLIDLFRNQPSLKILDLNGITNLNDDVVYALCALLPNVEEIQIRGCSITDKSLSKLFQLKKLKKLDISANYPISNSGFMKAVSNFAPVHLQSLDLNSVMVKNIDALIKQCIHLIYLDLSRCDISDEVVHIISENLIHLEHLSLKHTDITDYGLTGVKSTKEDQIETKENNEENCDYCDFLCNEDHKSLSNLKHLKKLKLNDCEKITDYGLIEAVRFQYLELLNVSGCHVKQKTIEILLFQNPSIKKIYCDDEMKHPKVAKKRPKHSFLDDELTVFNRTFSFGEEYRAFDEW